MWFPTRGHLRRGTDGAFQNPKRSREPKPRPAQNLSHYNLRFRVRIRVRVPNVSPGRRPVSLFRARVQLELGLLVRVLAS